MNVQRFLHTADHISTWVGKAAAWLIVALMLLVCAEVFKRYALNAPTAWIYDVNNMMYGTLFMLGGAYALAHDGHVRGDFLYGSMKPRTHGSRTQVRKCSISNRNGLGSPRNRSVGSPSDTIRSGSTFRRWSTTSCVSSS